MRAARVRFIFSQTARLERRARRIADPVERLRYLRQNTSVSDIIAASHREWPRLGMVWRKVAPAACWILMFLPAPVPSSTRETYVRESTLVAPSRQPKLQQTANVWLVDQNDEFEAYSNGLRVEKAMTTSNRPRRFYPIFSRDDASTAIQSWSAAPAGIVYHTTESSLVPFAPEENGRLKRIAQSLVGFVRSQRSYHFVIDRFGRVYRVVQESDAANHAGLSVWSDERGFYVNLNDSFLGIAFEAQTEAGAELPSISPAQVHAGRVLTEMLRAKYRIPAGNCVTHAQVSVNPRNMRIGYHTDWAGNFPFIEMGLPDNYEIPPPSLYAFGFGYDGVFLRATGSHPWKGILAAEERVRRQAAAQGLSEMRYRAALERRYRQIESALKSQLGAVEERDHESNE